MKTVRLTTAQAIVRFLTAQRTIVDGDVAQGARRQEPASDALVHDAAGVDPRRLPGS